MERHRIAFILSSIAGVLMLISAVFITSLFLFFGAFFGTLERLGAGTLLFPPLMAAFPAVGIVFAVLVLVGAFMMKSGEPSKVRTGSIIVLVFSIFSTVGGGGFLIGLILGVVGAIIGLTSKPQQP